MFDNDSPSRPCLPPWQRRLRHLRAIELHSVNFDPGTSRPSGLVVELWPLPSSVLHSKPDVDNLLQTMLSQEGDDGAPTSGAAGVAPDVSSYVAEGPLHCTTAVACSLQPKWAIDPAEVSARAGAARGVRVVLRRVAVAGVEGSADYHVDDAPCVWERFVRFDDLIHLVVDAAALPPLLPPGVLLLHFVDGLCMTFDDVRPLDEAGLLAPKLRIDDRQPSKQLPAEPSGVDSAEQAAEAALPAEAEAAAAAAVDPDLRPSSVAAQEAWVQEALRLSALHSVQQTENGAARATAEGMLEARAQRVRRRQTLRAQAATLAALRDQRTVALAAIESERALIEQAKDATSASTARAEAAARALESVVQKGERARLATPAGAQLLVDRRKREHAKRRSLLMELCEALPLDQLGGGAGGRPKTPTPPQSPVAGGSPAALGAPGSVRSPASEAMSPAALAVSPPGVLSTASAALSTAQAGGADEEDVAAVLGDAAMLVLNAARLLSVSLRYPLRLAASRCSIDDPPPSLGGGGGAAGGASNGAPSKGGGASGASSAAAALKAQQSTTYPLYSKGADPMRLQHAVLLLGRDVQQLLAVLGELPPQPTSAILPALHMLFQRIHAEWPLLLPESTLPAQAPPAQTPPLPAPTPPPPKYEDAAAKPAAPPTPYAGAVKLDPDTSLFSSPLIASPD